MNLHYSIYMQVEILLGYLTLPIKAILLFLSTQVEILLGYLTIYLLLYELEIYTSRNSFRLLNSQDSTGRYGSTQVEILLGYLTKMDQSEIVNLHK